MKILITGANGMLGRALTKELLHHEIIQHNRYISDLAVASDANKFYNFVARVEPDYIIHTAALVGGLNYNKEKPYDFAHINNTINNVVLDAAITNNVPKFLGILSVCCYGEGFNAKEYPLTEDKLFIKEPHPTNAAYAYSKRSLAQSILAANNQFNLRYNYLIPTNLYGELDHRGNKAHFCSIMIDKIIDAVENGKSKIDFIGDGEAKRQYIHVDDLAKIIRRHIELDINDNYNVASEEEMMAKTMIDIALTYCGQRHIEYQFHNTMTKGQNYRTVSNQLFRKYHDGFQFVPFYEGVVKVYNKWLNQ